MFQDSMYRYIIGLIINKYLVSSTLAGGGNDADIIIKMALLKKIKKI